MVWYSSKMVFLTKVIFLIFNKINLNLRRASKDTYSEDEDEHKGTNMLLIADEDFSKIEVISEKIETIFKLFQY